MKNSERNNETINGLVLTGHSRSEIILEKNSQNANLKKPSQESYIP